VTNASQTSGITDYEVGYGKPPVAKRFRKGRSGNPRGRPRGTTARRLEAIILKEAYRLVKVKEGDNVELVPAIRAILRSQIAHAAKGNGPAQRALIESVRASEQELASQAAAEVKEKAAERPLSDLEKARRIAFILNKGRRELERQNEIIPDHVPPGTKASLQNATRLTNERR
jgi:hypothetical protein